MPLKNTTTRKPSTTSSPQKKTAGRQRRLPRTPSRKNKALVAKLKRLWDKMDHPSPNNQAPYQLKPGIYEDLTFENYAAIPAINFSSLKNLELSPAHYKHAPSRPESDSLRIGNFIHTAVLEPDRLLDRYLVMPDFTHQIGNDPKTNQPYKNPRATKAYKDLVQEFHQTHPDKIIVTLEEFNDLVQINKGIYSNPDAAEILTDSTNELTIVWEDPDTHLMCKGRIDVLNKEYSIIGDLKTTADLSRFELDRYGYHQQQAFYQYGYYLLTGETYIPYIFAVEKSAPYACRCAPVSPAALSVGLEEIKSKLSLIVECQNAGHWPGPSNPKFWSLSRYYIQYDGLY